MTVLTFKHRGLQPEWEPQICRYLSRVMVEGATRCEDRKLYAYELAVMPNENPELVKELICMALPEELHRHIDEERADRLWSAGFCGALADLDKEGAKAAMRGALEKMGCELVSVPVKGEGK